MTPTNWIENDFSHFYLIHGLHLLIYFEKQIFFHIENSLCQYPVRVSFTSSQLSREKKNVKINRNWETRNSKLLKQKFALKCSKCVINARIFEFKCIFYTMNNICAYTSIQNGNFAIAFKEFLGKYSLHCKMCHWNEWRRNERVQNDEKQEKEEEFT